MTDMGEQQVPGTVFTPRQIRILKFAVVGMGVLLVGGFAFVLATIVYQASRPVQYATATSTPAAAGAAATDIELPAAFGASVTGISLDGDRLAVQIDAMGQQQIAIIDLATGEVVAQVKVKPQKP